MGKQASHSADESTLCRHPSQWWRSELLIRSLLAHPRGGRLKVEAVYEVISGCASWERVARRLGTTAFIVEYWSRQLQEIVARELWSEYKRYQEQAKQAKPHPYLRYYGDLR